MGPTSNDSGVPIRILESWLFPEVMKSIDPNINYINPIVKKNFQPTVLKITFLLRILEFIATIKSNDITAVLSDSTHKILAIFKFDSAIVDFENKNHQRMTCNTVNRVIHIKRANLKFIDIDYINMNFKLTLKGALDIVVLEILEFEVFLVDPFQFDRSTELKLKYLYDEPEYDNLCRRKPNINVFKYDNGLIDFP